MASPPSSSDSLWSRHWQKTLRPLTVALTGGVSGGALFHAAGLPLAWMLGAMAAVTALAVAGLRPQIPHSLRLGMLGVLGVLLGSSFTPGLFGQLLGWWPSMVGLVILTIITPLMTSRLFLWTGHNRVTAYFAGAPGGINEMVMIGGSLGGDERTIALVHSLRILLVVFSVPLCFHVLGGQYPDTSGHSTASPWSVFADPLEAALLLGCLAFGLPVGKLLRLPAPPLIGPMALSAVTHLASWTTLHPPAELVAIAQVVVGSALGARFSGVAVRVLLKLSMVAILSSILMIGLAMVAAAIIGHLTGVPFILLLLSYVPGGVAEMSLVSMALGMDVAFVASHHMVRIALVIAIAPAVFRWWYRRHASPSEL